MRAASRVNFSTSIGFGRNASMPVGRFDSDMSTALIKMTGISRRVWLLHRLRQNAQPSMIGIIRSRRMNAGVVGNVVRALSASSPCRAPRVSNPASSRRSQRASLIASSSSTTRTRGRLGSASEVASALSASLMTAPRLEPPSNVRKRRDRSPAPGSHACAAPSGFGPPAADERHLSRLTRTPWFASCQSRSRERTDSPGEENERPAFA